MMSQGHEMYCHDLEVIGSNPGQVELGVRSASKSSLNQNNAHPISINN